jgi:membrane protein implicated in regulation of membrane protease activity
MELELYQITLALALGLLIVEMLTGTFFFVGLSAGAATVAALHFHYQEVDISRDFLALAIVSAITFLTLRKLMAKSADVTSSENDVNRY